MLFTGTYRRTVDDKLRLAMPKPLRDQLPADRRIYVTQGLDGCLAAYTESAFAVLGERLAAGSPAAQEIRAYSRMFYSQAVCVVLDVQWRLRLTPELVRWAELEGEVVLVGVRDHLEIWANKKWGEYMARCDPQYDALAERALTTPFPSQPPAAREPFSAVERLPQHPR